MEFSASYEHFNRNKSARSENKNRLKCHGKLKLWELPGAIATWLDPDQEHLGASCVYSPFTRVFNETARQLNRAPFRAGRERRRARGKQASLIDSPL